MQKFSYAPFDIVEADGHVVAENLVVEFEGFQRDADMAVRRAGEYSARWPQFFASMDWKHLKYNFDLPRN